MTQLDLLFHDHTVDYLRPLQPAKNAEVTVTLRAGAHEIAEAYVCVMSEETPYPMKRLRGKNGFDYFWATLPTGETSLFYRFYVICIDGTRAFFDRRGAYDADLQMPESEMLFYLEPGFKTPEWAEGAVIYQIFVDRFYNGDPGNDVVNHEYQYIDGHVKRVEQWGSPPDPDRDYGEFYGGDLQGVMDKLDYLAYLGIDAIYLNPIFVSPSSHKDDTQDYDHIDPHFGRIVSDRGDLLSSDETDNRKATRYIDRVTNPENLEASDALFAQLVQEAHRRGIRVILDGVFNHCGSFHKWMDREGIYENNPAYPDGAYHSEDSLFREFFCFTKDAWPDNGSYEGWWGHDTLPKLNYENSEDLCEYILDIGRKWVSAPYYADGWRLDVAADLGHSEAFNHAFWQRFRDAVKEANPNAVILAEHYGAVGSWLTGREWDSLMNYDAFMEPLSFFLTGMEKHSEEFRADLAGNHVYFWDTMRGLYSQRFTAASLRMSMNELSNHDHSRFLTRTNRMTGRVGVLGADSASRDVMPGVFRQAALFQFTWIGAPTIYYGDEAGLCGFTDPDNRRTYPWGEEDQDLIEFHRVLIRIHSTCPELKYGSVREIYSEHGLISYGRFTGHTASLIVINRNRYAVTREYPVRRMGIPASCEMKRILITTAEGYRTDAVTRSVEDGVMTLLSPPLSALIVRYDPITPLSTEEFWRYNKIDFG